MRVLIACEYSGRVREAFRALGHNAWSCDFLPSEDNSRFHIQQDVRSILTDGWDLMIAHPDCTYLTNAAEWCYKDDPGKKMSPGILFGAERRKAREDALEFVNLLLNAPIPRIAIENPVGVISTRIRKPDQIIQPYEYGEDASKSTCLWLKNLSLLRPTKFVEPRWVCCGSVLPKGVGKYGCPNCCGEKKPRPRWANQTDSGQNKLGPSEDRWKERARTYQGWALAMAIQWGGLSMGGKTYHDWNEVVAVFDAELEAGEVL